MARDLQGAGASEIGSLVMPDLVVLAILAVLLFFGLYPAMRKGDKP